MDTLTIIGILLLAVWLWRKYETNQKRQRMIEMGLAGEDLPFVRATREYRFKVMELQNHKCANPYCNTDLRDGSPHWDHIVPRALGGTDSIHNMQWLCETCNMNKGTTGWVDFMNEYAKGLGIKEHRTYEMTKKWATARVKNGLGCRVM